jgi:hypothetical protein
MLIAHVAEQHGDCDDGGFCTRPRTAQQARDRVPDHGAETDRLRGSGRVHHGSDAMSETSPLTGELSNSKVAAVFPDEGAARRAAQDVATTLALGAAQVQVITPTEPHPGRKLEPESRGIWRTIVISHVKLGIAGAVVGLLVFVLLYELGIAFVVNSAVAAALVLLGFGATAGLFLGGFVSLRMDHDRYVQAARDAMKAGHTTVVVHAFSMAQREQAADFLRGQGGDVTSTL